MSVIAFASSKGGAGKTTAAIVLATTLARSHKVTVIDADPAGRLMSWSRKAPLPGRLEVRPTQGERFILDEISRARAHSEFVIIDLQGAATKLSGQHRRSERGRAKTGDPGGLSEELGTKVGVSRRSSIELTNARSAGSQRAMARRTEMGGWGCECDQYL